MRAARIRQILAFLVVGGASAAVDALVYLLLTWWGVHPVLASAVSFMSAFGVNYGGNRQIVFRARGQRGTLWRYVVLVVVNLGLSAAFVAAGLAVGFGPILAKLVSIVAIAAINYVAMRWWVFRIRPEAPPGSTAPES